MTTDFDLTVVGSGFSGSLTAMIARRLGYSVVLLERGQHPRFAIGESSTPLTNLLLEELARRYDLPRLLPLCKWGTWQREYPKIAAGLKRGFTFYHHQSGRPFAADPERRNQLLVAASPQDEIADTHWYRPDFDHFLVREAQALGAVYIDQVRIDRVSFDAHAVQLEGGRLRQPINVRARLLVDATGPRGFLQRALDLPVTEFHEYPRTQALYTHFSRVDRLDRMGVWGSEGAPYPVDDAAVHHVFEGGWVWVLRFNNGITSAGVAAADGLADGLRLAAGEAAWKRLLVRFPTLSEQFRDARPVLPFVHLPRLPFRCSRIAGANWVLLPSAAGVVDPLLSTGFPLTILGIQRLGAMLEGGFDGDQTARQLTEYSEQTLRELNRTALLVGTLYRSMHDFELFAPLSLLYFAAASFTESARRLNKAELAGNSFLLGDRAPFSSEMANCCLAAAEASRVSPAGRSEKDRLLEQVFRTIEPVDVVGLGKRERQNWYPALASDLFEASAKLGVSFAEIDEMLKRCGFSQ